MNEASRPLCAVAFKYGLRISNLNPFLQRVEDMEWFKRRKEMVWRAALERSDDHHGYLWIPPYDRALYFHAHSTEGFGDRQIYSEIAIYRVMPDTDSRSGYDIKFLQTFTDPVEAARFIGQQAKHIRDLVSEAKLNFIKPKPRHNGGRKRRCRRSKMARERMQNERRRIKNAAVNQAAEFET